MTFQDSVKSVFRNYATFGGRAARSEYWWFMLFSFIVSAILGVIEGPRMGGMHGGGTLQAVWSLAVLIPSLAVGARRLHDTDRSGWWLLLCLIPVVGLIVLIWWFATPGTRGENRFGADPLGGLGPVHV